MLEPAALGVPVIVGPHTFNFEEVTDFLLERGAALRVPDADVLARELQRLLGDPAQRAAMGRAAICAVEAQRGAVARTLKIIDRVVAGEQPITSNPGAGC